jgi:hypothetical protein
VNIGTLWAAAQREVLGLARHELRGAINGLSVNLEVLKSRTDSGKIDHQAIAPFVDAAYQSLIETSARAEAMMFLGPAQRDVGQADVAVALKHLAALLVPAAKGDGTSLDVAGYDTSVPTSALPMAVRLALASGLLALIKEGGGRCRLEPGKEGAGAVVRFSHESAPVGELDPALACVLGHENIRISRSDKDLQMAFPGTT